MTRQEFALILYKNNIQSARLRANNKYAKSVNPL